MTDALVRQDINPAKTFMVTSGDERYPLVDGVEAIGLAALARELAETGADRQAISVSVAISTATTRSRPACLAR